VGPGWGAPRLGFSDGKNTLPAPPVFSVGLDDRRETTRSVTQVGGQVHHDLIPVEDGGELVGHEIRVDRATGMRCASRTSENATAPLSGATSTLSEVACDPCAAAVAASTSISQVCDGASAPVIVVVQRGESTCRLGATPIADQPPQPHPGHIQVRDLICLLRPAMSLPRGGRMRL